MLGLAESFVEDTLEQQPQQQQEAGELERAGSDDLRFGSAQSIAVEGSTGGAGDAVDAEDGSTLMLLDSGDMGALVSAVSPLGLGNWASAAFDMFVRETSSLLDALEAQQQRVAGAVLQQQAQAAAAAAAPPLPRRPCPHHAAMLAARRAAASEAAGEEAPMPRAAFAVIGGMPLQLVDLSPGALDEDALARVHSDDWAFGGDSDDLAYDVSGDYSVDYDGEVVRSGEGARVDQVLVWVLSFVCAATFVAFVHSLLHLRAVVAASHAAESGAYIGLAADSDDDAAARGAFRSGGGLPRRAARRSVADALEHPLLVDAADAKCAREIAGARVMVVGYERDSSRKDTGPAAQSYANECYQPLRD